MPSGSPSNACARPRNGPRPGERRTPPVAAAQQRVLILLTDGANTAGSIEPRKAAELAAREGVRIYTIGVGADPRGAFGLRLGGAQIDEPTLEAIAQTTGGRFFRARDIRALQEIYAVLDELEPAVSDEQTWRPVDDLFQWPLGLALGLSGLIGLTRAVPAPGRLRPRTTESTHRCCTTSIFSPQSGSWPCCPWC